MTDNTGDLILSQLKQFWSKMADCIDDVVHGIELKGSFNIVNILIIAWILFGIIIYFVGHLISSRIYQNKETSAKITRDKNPPAENGIKNEEKTLISAKTKPNDLEIHQSEHEEIEEPTCIAELTNQHQLAHNSEPSVEPEPIPQSTGTNKNAVQWVNKVLEWIYTNSSTSGPILIESWISALNNKLQKLAPDHGILLELDLNLVAEETSSAVLSDVHTSLDPTGNLVTTGLFHCAGLSCPLAAAALDGAQRPHRFQLLLEHLSATIKADYQPEVQAFLLQFVGKPDFSLMIDVADEEDAGEPASDIPQERILDLLHEAFNSLDIEVTFAYSPDFPSYKKVGHILENGLAGTPVRTPPPVHKLLVKVIKAFTPTEHKGGLVCVLEMDSPHQRYETTAAKDAPFWDELFYFDISPSSNCLLVSLLSCGKQTSSGTALVGEAQVAMHEILKNPSHRQILPLQAPEGDEMAAGNLTLEFLLNGGEDFPHLGIGHGKIIEMNSRLTSTGSVIKTTTIKKSAEDVSSSSSEASVEVLAEEASIAEVAPLSNGFKDEDAEGACTPPPPLHLPPSPTPSTSCPSTPVNEAHPNPLEPIVIKEWSDKQNGSTPTLSHKELSLPIALDGQEPVILPSPDQLHPLAEDEADDITDAALRQLEVGHNGTAASRSTLIIHSVQKVRKPKQTTTTNEEENLQLSPNSVNGEDTQPAAEPKEQGQHAPRPKERKSLMNTIRKRLSFRRAGSRSKSADQYSQNGDTKDKSRSASSDRSSHKGDKYLNLPKGDETNGSVSEASAISGSSNRTFVNERSTLILETTENGVTRRYIVPPSMSHTWRKWGKPAGIKLHVFNEHTFVARHISGAAKCNVCQQHLIRRPGKQGYVCRDCSFLCHKACHVKAEIVCPSSTINTLEVEYMQEPRGASKPKTS